MKTYMVITKDNESGEQEATFLNNGNVVAHLIRVLLVGDLYTVELYKRGVWGYERANISDELSEYFK